MAINQNTLWITGGENDYVDLNSTEFLSFFGQQQQQNSKKGPDLPFNIERHGMVIYNENSIYIIGGYQDGTLSGKSWIVDLSKGGFKLKEGPTLNIPRSRDPIIYFFDGRQDMNRVSSFSKCLNGTFPQRNFSVKTLVQ